MLNLISLSIIMVVLVLFRRSQRRLDIQIDESQITPSDFTVCVKNIPKGLAVDYKKEITNLFQNYAVFDSEMEMKVTKVVLVYDIEEIIQLENEINELIKQKKRILERNK